MLPLLGFREGTQTLIWHRGRALTRGEFCRAALLLAERLPAAEYAINLASGRLAFLLGFAAAVLRGQTTLLPPNQSAEALAVIQRTYPLHHVLDDELVHGMSFAGTGEAPLIFPDARVAMLFTSGSTGAPQPQIKTWQTLFDTGALDAARFLIPEQRQCITLIATVPSQHMFGLQTTVLLPFAGNCAILDARPFFPADIRQALESVPAPRALISTPMHLRTCLDSGIALPSLEFVLSATAQMAVDLARDIEARWATRVWEIYGSTEAGTIGTRRTTAGDAWRLLPNGSLEVRADQTLYRSTHLPHALALNDRVELISDSEFRLLGRTGDQIKIAGKRATFAELTQALLSIPGVRDGIVFMPTDSSRTAALAVTTGLTRADVLDQLAQRIDPVFLPRPLLLVDELPRNAVGKLPRNALLALLRSQSNR